MAPSSNWQPISRVLWIILAVSIEFGAVTSVAGASGDSDPPNEDDGQELRDEADGRDAAESGEPRA